MRAAQRSPGDPAVGSMLSRLLTRMGEHDAAAHWARRAALAAPASPDHRLLLGEALMHAGKTDEALAATDDAVRLAPGDRRVRLARLVALECAGRYADAEAGAREALGDDPRDAEAAQRLASLLGALGRSAEALALLESAAAQRPDDHSLATDLCAASLYAGHVSARALFERFLSYGALLERLAPTRPIAHPNTREPERRLRVGFLSPDLRAHPVATFVAPILTGLDRARFDLVVYSTTPAEDAVSKSLRGLALEWKPRPFPDASALAAEIFTDRIDILIDLSGHSTGHLLAVPHVRPAPVQMTYVGYPSTTGVAAIGWRITDSVADPPGAEAFHTERLLRIDPCALCYTPPGSRGERDAPPPFPGAPPGTERAEREAGSVVFGSFNTLAKVTDEVVALWSRLLGEVPGSRLILKHNVLAGEQGREVVRGRFAARGVDPARLGLLGPTPLREHLEAYARIDVALDPFPFSGATTMCDALFMGVPVVTMRGETSASRVGASILTYVGASEWIAGSEDQYTTIASSLAADPARLADLRRSLRTRMLASPLCDAPAFARRFGEALREAWRGYCARGG